jgi:hypothetical protein
VKAEQVAKAVEELEKLIKSEVRDETPKQSPADRRVAPGQISGTNALRHLLWCLMNVLQFMGDDRTEKAMRWLGFVQGAVWMHGMASVDILKDMNKPIPKYVLKNPGQEMTPVQALTFINTLQQYMFEVGDRQIDPDKEISGADLVDTVASMLDVYGLTPQVDEEPEKAEEPGNVDELQGELKKFKEALTNENFAHREAFQRAMKAEERVRNLERQLSDSMNLNEYQKAVREFRLVMQVPGDETLVKYGQRMLVRVKELERSIDTKCQVIERQAEQLHFAVNENNELKKSLEMEKKAYEGLARLHSKPPTKSRSTKR